MPRELFIATRQENKIRNAFANNMLKDLKLNEAQLSEITQSGGFLGKTLGNVIDNLRKKALIDLTFSLARDVLSKIVTKATSQFERKINGRRAVRAWKGVSLFIPSENMDDTIKIVESLEK